MKNAVELRPLSPPPLTAIKYSSADVEQGNTRLPLSKKTNDIAPFMSVLEPTKI